MEVQTWKRPIDSEPVNYVQHKLFTSLGPLTTRVIRHDLPKQIHE